MANARNNPPAQMTILETQGEEKEATKSTDEK